MQPALSYVWLAHLFVLCCADIEHTCWWREQAALSKQLAKDGEESYVFQIVDEVKSFLSMLKDKVWPVLVAFGTSTSLFVVLLKFSSESARPSLLSYCGFG